MMIRQAVPGDLTDINAVHAAAGRAPWTSQVIEDHESRFAAVAVVAGIVRGAGKTHFFAEPDGPAPEGHYLGGVAVHPDYRRRGIGAALTRARLEWVWSRCNEVYYVADESNTASIALHVAFAFEEIERTCTLRGRHADRPGENLILFRASRPPGDVQLVQPIGMR